MGDHAIHYTGLSEKTFHKEIFVLFQVTLPSFLSLIFKFTPIFIIFLSFYHKDNFNASV